MGSGSSPTRDDDAWSVEEALDRQLEKEPGPRPSPRFRQRAWRDFQRSIDPLAPPRPLPTPRPR